MKLYLFTANYPFGFGESYLNNELPYLTESFDQVDIFPFDPAGNMQNAFEKKNNIIHHNYQEEQLSFKDKIFVFRVFLKEFFKMPNKTFYLKKSRVFLAQLAQACKLMKWIEKQNLQPDAIYYSYWMNEWALALAMLKFRGKISKFFFRVNGYDIWNDRHEGNYLPFRYFIYSQTDMVVTLSKTTRDYLKGLNIHPEKIKLCYFGTKDFGPVDERQTDQYVIFSCSSAIPLKRLDKIAQVIRLLDFPVKWVHHGDGKTMDEVQKIMTSCDDHIEFVNTKKVDDYHQVLMMQKSLSPDLFVNLSSTEGMPVTLLEALSMGIPILVNNVGSCHELVNEKTGILVDVNASITEIAAEINNLRNQNFAKTNKAAIRSYWQNNFWAEKAYKEYAEMIINHYK